MEAPPDKFSSALVHLWLSQMDDPVTIRVSADIAKETLANSWRLSRRRPYLSYGFLLQEELRALRRPQNATMKKQTTKDPIRKEPKPESAVARLHAHEPGLPEAPPSPVSIAGPSGYFTPLSAERGQASKKKTDHGKQKQNKNEDIP